MLLFRRCKRNTVEGTNHISIVCRFFFLEDEINLFVNKRHLFLLHKPLSKSLLSHQCRSWQPRRHATATTEQQRRVWALLPGASCQRRLLPCLLLPLPAGPHLLPDAHRPPHLTRLLPAGAAGVPAAAGVCSSPYLHCFWIHCSRLLYRAWLAV